MTTNATTNATTLASYEQIAADYAASTAGPPTGVAAAGLRRLLEHCADRGPTADVLELASGPGWDADFLEAQGARVRRTDAARAFCDLQAVRGRVAERLDAITDPYTDDRRPSYDAVVALCLLLHVDRGDAPTLLAKVAGALRPGGAFLVSFREGDGEVWEHGSSGLGYHVTFWTGPAFDEALRAAGLTPVWRARSIHDDGAWLTVLATRTAAGAR